MKYNANEEIGNKYFKEYKCQGVPHLLFLDSMGNEVDRIIGFLSPTEYLLRIKDIAQKRNTLNDYLSRYEKGERNVEVITAIAMKYEDRNENDNAAQYYSMLINEYPDKNSDSKKKCLGETGELNIEVVAVSVCDPRRKWLVHVRFAQDDQADHNPLQRMSCLHLFIHPISLLAAS